MPLANREASSDSVIRSRLRSFIDRELAYGDDFPYDDESSFLDEGLVDSMGVMEIVAYLQREFGIAIESREVTPRNFDSVNKLTAFVLQKLSLSVNGEGLDVGARRATEI